MEELNKARLRWHCRRGMLELDVILKSFFEDVFDSLNYKQQLQFSELLAQVDTNLYAWILGFQQPSEPHLQEIINLIKSYALPKSSTSSF